MTGSREANRRNFHRVGFDAPTRLWRADCEFRTTLVDISLNGALLQCPEDWSGGSGDRFNLEIQLNDGSIFIRMGARVIHQEENTIGLHCEEIDLDSISHLRRLVELNLGDHSALERELEALG